MARSGLVRVRQGILIASLIILITLGINLKISNRRYNLELIEVGNEVIEKYNKEHPLEPADASSGTYTDIETSCTRRYVLFGTPRGTVVLNVNPREEREQEKLNDVAASKLRQNPALRLVYVYERQKDGWKLLESYSDH